MKRLDHNFPWSSIDKRSLQAPDLCCWRRRTVQTNDKRVPSWTPTELTELLELLCHTELLGGFTSIIIGGKYRNFRWNSTTILSGSHAGVPTGFNKEFFVELLLKLSVKLFQEFPVELIQKFWVELLQKLSVEFQQKFFTVELIHKFLVDVL